MKRVINSENYRIERHSSLSPNTISREINENRAKHNAPPPKYRVSRSREKIKLTQKYRIINALDPNTNIVYSLNQIVTLKLINKYTSCFCVPSTGQLIALDEAIQLGYVKAELIDEFLETSNESYEFIQHDGQQTAEKVVTTNDDLVRIDNLNKTSLSSINSIIKVVLFA